MTVDIKTENQRQRIRSNCLGLKKTENLNEER